MSWKNSSVKPETACIIKIINGYSINFWNWEAFNENCLSGEERWV